MKKSLFSRFTVAFLSVVLISFAVLGILIVSLVSGHMVEQKRNDVKQTSNALSQFFMTGYQSGNVSDFNRFIFSNYEYTKSAIILETADTAEKEIYLLDSKGNLIICSDESKQNMNFTVAALSSAKSKEPFLTDMNGNFEEKKLTCVSPIYRTPDNQWEIVGYVLVTCPSNLLSGFVGIVIRTVAISILWVVLATMLVVFLITEKVKKPLREMSRAAKSYASGQFDIRVPVNGEDEIAELATAFNTMANSLQNLENMRSSFISNVSHELRTPMTSIAGFIEGMQTGAIPPEKQPYYQQLVADEVRRLSRLVTSLLDISRIQAGDRKFKPIAFDICEIARMILISFEQRIDDKHLDVMFDAPEDRLMVYADKDAIYQVLYNICDNAIKFSKDGGHYQITIEEKDKRVFVSVFNEGIGIDPDELPMVFDRFYKSDKSRGLDKNGVGLGMYITKTIMDAHGQEIWVTSKHGENCEFTFTLQALTE